MHVFGGCHVGPLAPYSAEVSEWRWITLPALEADMRARPEAYTVWFRKYLAEHHARIAAWLAAAC